jgi:hypothetical protein
MRGHQIRSMISMLYGGVPDICSYPAGGCQKRHTQKTTCKKPASKFRAGYGLSVLFHTTGERITQGTDNDILKTCNIKKRKSGKVTQPNPGGSDAIAAFLI